MPPEAGGRVYGVKMENNAVGLEIESYPFDPVLPNGASVMMMGTFPPKEDKRAMQFHYPNFQNDMWRVYGLVFFNDAAHFQMPSEKAFDGCRIRDFLNRAGIASCPTVLKAAREHGNASDKFLKAVETVDLAAVLAKIPRCRHILYDGRQGDGNPARYSGRRHQNAENGRNRAVSVCRTGFDPDPPAVHFARLSFEFGEKGGGVSGVFRNGGFV